MRYEQVQYDHDHIGVGKGWKDLVIPIIDLCHLYSVEIQQIKEKFGTLRIYVKSDKEIEDRVRMVRTLIDAVETRSGRTCEDCGEEGIEMVDGTLPGNDLKIIYKAKRRGPGWIRTLCDPCREVWEKKLQERGAM